MCFIYAYKSKTYNVTTKFMKPQNMSVRRPKPQGRLSWTDPSANHKLLDWIYKQLLVLSLPESTYTILVILLLHFFHNILKLSIGTFDREWQWKSLTFMYFLQKYLQKKSLV